MLQKYNGILSHMAYSKSAIEKTIYSLQVIMSCLLKWFFHSPPSPSSRWRKLWFLFTFCHSGGIIHISEVVDVSPTHLILACNSSSLTFLMMCSVYRLNKQGNSIQLCHTPFSILSQPVVLYRVLTAASWPTCRFLRRQVRWSGSPISLRAFCSLSWSTESKALV